ncbi:Clp protease N-terminal domain-containing protein [Streptomyces luteocolor]|uniref:Clp protease N-terminal domain-containing protein n=1 Tax=Streptomyces luteocolor TaxID=285500 RepID=UPI0008530517|nr:Clp protease N-terminal domain-containing protein [Streptomyces luteocolor]
MFERFTEDARDVVMGAVEQARRAGAASVDDGHLLLALLARLDEGSGSRAAFALTALGAADRRESIERALAEARRRGGLSQADTEALAGLGIDVEEIVSRVEEAHGVGVLAGAGVGAGAAGGAGALDGEGRERRSLLSRTGHLPFARDAKDVLVKSLRIASTRRDRAIGGQHLLLALTVRPGVVSEVLADHGVTHAGLERLLFAGASPSA